MNTKDIVRLAKEAAEIHGHTIKTTDEIVETLTSFAFLVKSRAWKEWCEADIQGQVERTHYNKGVIDGTFAERKECLRICDEEVKKHGRTASVIVCASLIKARDDK